MEEALSVLLVEDDPADAVLLKDMVDRQSRVALEFVHVQSLAAASERLASQPVDAVLLDLGLPESWGLDTFRRALPVFEGLPVVILTDLADHSSGLTAVREGAQDYLVKGEVTPELLVRSLVYAVERRQAADALRQSLSRTEGLLEAIPDLVLELADDGTCLAVSGSGRVPVGSVDGPWTGRRVHELLPEDMAHQLLTATETALLEGETVPIRCGAMGAQEARQYEVRVAPAGDGRAVAILRDVTEQARAESERKRLEARLRQVQKLEAMGTLAGGIGHDFNNILSAVLGYTEISLAMAEGDANLRANLERGLEAAEKARDMIGQLVAFSRQAEHEPSPVAAASLIEEALASLRPVIPDGVRVRMALEFRDTVMADPAQLRQVVVGLLRNALQAVGERGEVTIALSREFVSETRAPVCGDLRPGAYMKLAIGDTGDGMDPETLERAFDPFFTTREEGQGSGLGLSSAHGIVVQHAGAIDVDTGVGRGTTVSVYLPVSTVAAPRAVPSAAELPAGTERILLVDTEDALSVMAEQMLSALGYRVVRESSSLEAWEVFQVRPDDYDLLLVDEAMPYMSGYQLAEAIKGIRPHMPTLVATSYRDASPVESSPSPAVDGYLMKPYSVRQLGETVRRALDSRTV
jgi:signal transduction histidine kinase